MSHTATLLLGSNVPDRDWRLANAVAEITRIANILARSDIFISPDRSGLGAPYANIAIQCATELTCEQIRAAISGIETRLGRTPQSKLSGIMPVDIDLVIWDDTVVSKSDYDTPYFVHCASTLR